MIGAGLLLAASLASADLDATFDRGVAAYREGKWEEAEGAWRAMAEAGVHDPRVEYNLGNAAWKQGRLGEAIWRWERARRLDPDDRDLRSNLALARHTLSEIEKNLVI